MSTNHVIYSEIDSQRYGVKIARSNNITADLLPNILETCKNESVDMLIARCPTHDLKTAQEMEKAGFLLMDTLIYYTFSFDKQTIPQDTSAIPLRSVKPEDEAGVGEVAREAFKGYYGHYHADDRLDTTHSNDAYVSWAQRSCVSREVADEVLIAEMDDEIVGFATLRLNSIDESEGVLFGVSPKAQGQGIYRSFIINGMLWGKEQGTDHMIVSTQITNIAVQKVWSRLGFTVAYSYYTFHKWF